MSSYVKLGGWNGTTRRAAVARGTRAPRARKGSQGVRGRICRRQEGKAPPRAGGPGSSSPRAVPVPKPVPLPLPRKCFSRVRARERPVGTAAEAQSPRSKGSFPDRTGDLCPLTGARTRPSAWADGEWPGEQPRTTVGPVGVGALGPSCLLRAAGS